MPHFVAEYSRNLEPLISIADMMHVIFEVASVSGVMAAKDFKVRAIPVEHMLFGGAVKTFIHITVSMLLGRSDQQKECLAVNLRSALADRIGHVDSISIDVRDMNPVAYKKYVPVEL